MNIISESAEKIVQLPAIVCDKLVGRLREMARAKHDEADRLYHTKDLTGGYGARCRAIGIEDAIKMIESQAQK